MRILSECVTDHYLVETRGGRWVTEDFIMEFGDNLEKSGVGTKMDVVLLKESASNGSRHGRIRAHADVILGLFVPVLRASDDAI